MIFHFSIRPVFEPQKEKKKLRNDPLVSHSFLTTSSDVVNNILLNILFYFLFFKKNNKI
jgi:hypothetical protein